MSLGTPSESDAAVGEFAKVRTCDRSGGHAVRPLEYLDLVDEHNRVLESVPRSRIRSENLLHRGVGILCWNSRGELFVHQRTATKDLFPSMYDMMVGGAVESGEAYLDSARREVAEELGVVGPEPRFLFEHLYLGPQNRSFVQIFEVVWDGPVRCQPEEICWGRWMPFPEVLEWVESVPVVPDGLEIFRKYLGMREAGE